LASVDRSVKICCMLRNDAVTDTAIEEQEPAAPIRVLVASPDTAYGAVLAKQLEMDGYAVGRCESSQELLRRMEQQRPDVLVLDLAFDDGGDIELVSFVRRQMPRTKIILLFDVARLERALEGVRRGAYFYLPKTALPSDVALMAGKAIRTMQNELRADRYENVLFEEMVGGSPAMKRVVELITKVAPTDSTVLLLGESGTGKDVLANMIHRLSPRRDMPFIAINCAALPENLLESEMFGHVKGAFTGAESDKRGLFEEADGGTAFLDEIGDMSPMTQAKLLRVLQNGEIRRVGESFTQRVNVRIIAATNHNLEEAVAARAFREDLYFRLNVVQIRIPPLREPMNALPKLVERLVSRYNAKYRKHVRGFDEQAEAFLRTYQYPGNIRELESIIAHAVIMCDGDIVRAKDLPDAIRTGMRPQLALPSPQQDSIPSISEMEQHLIRLALDRLDGNQTEAAAKLGISRSTLWRKMKEYGISKQP